MRHRLPQFGHLFSSDAYSAGYYSYLWSETMDADTWAAFEETGNPSRIRQDRRRASAPILLSTGNETDRAEAYRAVPRPRSGRRTRCSSGAASRPTRARRRGGGAVHRVQLLAEADGEAVLQRMASVGVGGEEGVERAALRAPEARWLGEGDGGDRR